MTRNSRQKGPGTLVIRATRSEQKDEQVNKWPSLTLQDSSRRLFLSPVVQPSGSLGSRGGGHSPTAPRPEARTPPLASTCQRAPARFPRGASGAGSVARVIFRSSPRAHTHILFIFPRERPGRIVGARSGRLSGRGSASAGAASATAVGARVSRDGEPRVRTRAGRRSRNPAHPRGGGGHFRPPGRRGESRAGGGGK